MCKVAIVEPIGGHGGNDTMNYLLLQMMKLNNIKASLFTSDSTPLREGFHVKTFYQNIYGDSNKIIKTIRYLKGTINSLLYAKKKGYNIIHFHLYRFDLLELFNVFITWTLFNFRIIATIHDVEAYGKNKLKIPAFSKYSIFIRCLDAIILHTNYSKNKLLQKIDRKAIFYKEVVVFPLIDINDKKNMRHDKDKARKQLGLPINKDIFLFFGQIKKAKGLDVLLKAVKEIAKENENFLLVVAGKMWQNNEVKYLKIIKENSIEKFIDMRIGYIDNKDVHCYMEAADAIVLPYKKVYNSGVLYRAMSYGIPVFASNLKTFKEDVVNDKNGFLFESESPESLSDTIIEKLRDKNHLQKIGKAGKKYINKRCNLKKIASEYNILYRKVLNI